MAKKVSILKPKASGKTTFSVKIDPLIAKELSDLEDRLESEAPELTLSRADIVEPALREAIDMANKELDKLGQEAFSEKEPQGAAFDVS